MDKRKKLIICLSVIGLILLLNYECIQNWIKVKESQIWLGIHMKPYDIEKLIEENINNTQYAEYIEVSMEKSEVIYKELDYEEFGKSLYPNFKYDFRIKNVSNEDIQIEYILYPHDELRKFDSTIQKWRKFSKGIPSSIYFLNSKTTKNIIKPGETISASYPNEIEIKYDDNSKEEIKALIKKYKDIAYLQVFIDDKEFYMQLEVTE